MSWIISSLAITWWLNIAGCICQLHHSLNCRLVRAKLTASNQPQHAKHL
jgi:hypothetical protein